MQECIFTLSTELQEWQCCILELKVSTQKGCTDSLERSIDVFIIIIKDHNRWEKKPSQNDHFKYYVGVLCSLDC